MRVTLTAIGLLFSIATLAQDEAYRAFYDYDGPTFKYDSIFKVYQELGLNGKVKEVRVIGSYSAFSDGHETNWKQPDFHAELNRAGEIIEFHEYTNYKDSVQVWSTLWFANKLIIKKAQYLHNESFVFYSYDKNGRLSKRTTSLKSDGSGVISSVNYYYNVDGKLSSCVEQGNWSKHFVYVGDSVVWMRETNIHEQLMGVRKLLKKDDHHPLTITYYTIDSAQNHGILAIRNYQSHKPHWEERFRWDDEGRLIRFQLLVLRDSNLKIVEDLLYSYKNGLLQSWTTRHADDEHVELYEYDKQGRQTRRALKEDKPSEGWFTSYDDTGNVVEEGEGSHRLRYYYTFDRYQNWIERALLQNAEKSMSSRIIEYYD